MLDPVVSARIKQFGLFKWACMDYPHLVFGATVALLGAGIGFYAGHLDEIRNRKTRYFFNYVVMRPDDPRLENIVVYGPDGTPVEK